MQMRLIPSIAFATLLAVTGLAQSPTPDPRAVEIDRLTKALIDEKDSYRRTQLNQQIWDLRLPMLQEEVTRLHEQWTKETDPEKKKEIGEDLSHAAIHSDQPQFVAEVATGGKFAEKEIKLDEKATPVLLRILKSFEPEKAQWSDHAAWVIRRMTRDRFELWLPHHGWLFDAKGKLLNEARPPRRDGMGREWYGAFLPDGRWVTTDLWEMDCTLHFFSRQGKWLKDIRSDELVPRKPDDEYSAPSLIGWCRCDREGKGFVLSVGANGGRGNAWVSAAGDHRLLREKESPWKISYPRDLEPKGMYTSLSVPNDAGDVQLHRSEPGHGSEVGFPTYSWSEVSLIIPGGRTFGFWPSSSDVYVVTEDYTAIDNADGTSDNGPVIRHTWFYNADSTFAGWINAVRLADTTKRDGMLFADEHGRIITLGKDRKLRSIEQFQWNDGLPASPRTLYPELRLGFFERGNEIALARW